MTLREAVHSAVLELSGSDDAATGAVDFADLFNPETGKKYQVVTGKEKEVVDIVKKFMAHKISCSEFFTSVCPPHVCAEEQLKSHLL